MIYIYITHESDLIHFKFKNEIWIIVAIMVSEKNDKEAAFMSKS